MEKRLGKEEAPFPSWLLFPRWQGHGLLFFFLHGVSSLFSVPSLEADDFSLRMVKAFRKRSPPRSFPPR